MFNKKGVSLKRDVGKGIQKGILKKNMESLKGEYLFSQDEEKILHNIILILGLQVSDV